jgi:hypothetical protein
LREIAKDLRRSIERRKGGLLDLGEHGPHRQRLNDEIHFLRSIEKRLGGKQFVDDP